MVRHAFEIPFTSNEESKKRRKNQRMKQKEYEKRVPATSKR